MKTKQKIINLYEDDEISSLKLVFSISNEDDLDQCWHHFHEDHDEASNGLNHFLPLFYKFTLKYTLTHTEHFFELIAEKSQDYYYLTIWNTLVAQAFEVCLDGHGVDFLSDEERITVRIEKTPIRIPKSIDSYVPVHQAETIQTVHRDKTVLPKHDFVSYDDLEDLLIACEDMQDIMMSVRKHGFVENLYIRLRSCFSLFTLCLGAYPQLASVTSSIESFSALINNNQDAFTNSKSDEIVLIDGFIHNIERWLRMLFIEGGVEVSFMDNSLYADLETIKMFLSPQEDEQSAEEDLAAIFDF